MGEAFDQAALEALVRAAGFDCIGAVSAADLQVRDEVRSMCASGRCRSYGRNWSCPPACGELEEFRRVVGSCAEGFVFQTVAQLEDEFDGETMMAAEAVHKRRVESLCAALADAGVSTGECLILSAGTCTRCATCAYPEPCRDPRHRLVSMEAAGLLVTDACTAAGIPYNHGKLTMAYSSCALLKGNADDR